MLQSKETSKRIEKENKEYRLKYLNYEIKKYTERVNRGSRSVTYWNDLSELKYLKSCLNNI